MGHDLTLSEIHQHHDHLIHEIQDQYQELIQSAEMGIALDKLRDDYVRFLRTELVPHALTEEATIYLEGREQDDLTTLVKGMTDEHQRIISLIEQLEHSQSPTRIVAAASGFFALISAHFDKENQLLLPALNQRGLLPN